MKKKREGGRTTVRHFGRSRCTTFFRGSGFVEIFFCSFEERSVLTLVRDLEMSRFVDSKSMLRSWVRVRARERLARRVLQLRLYLPLQR